MCVHTSVFLGIGCISCSFNVSNVFRAVRGGGLLAFGGTFFLMRPIRSCCDNKPQNTTSRGFIKASIYFSLADLWMSCCSSKLAWAQVLGQLHSLRPACHRRVSSNVGMVLSVWTTQAREGEQHTGCFSKTLLQASTPNLPILLSAHIPWVKTSQRA